MFFKKGFNTIINFQEARVDCYLLNNIHHSFVRLLIPKGTLNEVSSIYDFFFVSFSVFKYYGFAPPAPMRSSISTAVIDADTTKKLVFNGINW